MSSTTPSSSSWEPPSPEHLQRMLPQYEITDILGRGGMGAVYKGRQSNLDREVAIKVLPETFTKGDDELNFAARFKQEARAMAKLDHPAIISVYDFGETADGQLYFIMEFIDGMDIHQYLHHHGGKLPQEQALSITAHVLDALDYAHSHGIVHRDIKPANILLNREGRVKIADFGLAKKLEESGGDSVPALTMTNVAVGTPDFVAPEALDSSQKPDHRADLYAVGVMLYQMLTGKLPRGQFKSPSELDPAIDPRLDDIVSKSLQPHPEDRYSNAAMVRADLDAIFSRPFARVEAGEESDVVAAVVPVTTSVKDRPTAKGGAKPRPVSPPQPSKAPMFLGIGVTAALVLGLGAFFLFREGTSRQAYIGTTPKATSTPIVEERKVPGSAMPVNQPMASSVAAFPAASEIKPSAPPADTPAASEPSPGRWIRIYDMPDSLPEAIRDTKSKRSARLVDGWITPDAPGVQVIIPLPLSDDTDYGVRARFKASADDDGLTHGIVLRAQNPEDFRSQVYQLRRGQTVIHGQRRERDRDWTITQEPTEPLPRGGEFTLEFSVIGKRLISRYDGGAPQVGEDGTYAEGGAFIYLNSMAVRDIEIIRLDGLPEAEALKILDVDERGRDLRAPVDSTPKPPNPTTTAVEPPAPMPASPAPAAPVSAPAPAPPASPLTIVPGLKTRLDGFHTARRTQLGDLTKKYLAGLDTRLNQAADAGDLRLATAFEAEKNRVQTLQAALAQPPADPVAAVTEEPALPDLPAGSPDSLVALRQTWTTESAKIRTTLDAALGQSLQALEAELTRARDFESAKAVLTWREALADGSAGTPARPAAAAPAAPMTAVPTGDKAGKSARAPSDADLAAATKEKPFENSLGMKFVPVPGTEVLFCIHETRYRDYGEYVKKASAPIDGQWKTQNHDGFEIKVDGDEHPVTFVSWEDAQRFCDWLSEKESKTYRLPTDREWSLAVGIGDREKWEPDTTPETVFKVPDAFPWGEQWPPSAGAGNYSDASRRAKAPVANSKYVEGAYDDGFPTTAPVMRYEENDLGLFDLGGNVSELCEDWYSSEQNERVMRGASWNFSVRGSLLSSFRAGSAPERRTTYGGFRIVVETGAPATAPGSVTPATDPAASPSAPPKNPFGWQPIPENPFPLPRPSRPTTPCRVVAWRLDGQPVDEAAFREQFFGTPEEMGEVVDFSMISFLTGRFPAPLGLRSDGSLVFLGDRYEKQRSAELPRSVMVSGGNEVAAALAEDGTVSLIPISESVKAATDAFADVSSWKNIVLIEVSSEKAVYAIDSTGSFWMAGLNDKKQLEAPPEFRSKTLMVKQNGPSTFLLRLADGKLVANRFGPGDPWTIPQPKDTDFRFFFSSNVYVTNERGLIDFCNVGEDYPASFEKLRGVPTDIRDISVAQGGRANTPGIAALREGENHWRFWGERKELGRFDTKYCETKAEGCWKLFFGGDYVLALKPVANLKPDDWTGAKP